MIDSFSGPYRFLSNFYESQVSYEGIQYPTVEHAFQAAKTLDRAQRAHVASSRTPGIAKKRGREVSLRPDWENIKIEVMTGLLRQKFAKEPLRTWLLETGDQDLVEGNTWGDSFWGVHKGIGKNWLGIKLMHVRLELKKAQLDE